MQSATPLQFEPPFFVPDYRPVQCGAWELRRIEMLLCKGYWSDTQLCIGTTALLRDGRTWMSITPMEVESQQIGVALAEGHVAVFGLGMGWSAAASALRPDVTRVSVVELDPDVIALHELIGTLDQLPAEARAKVRIEQGDALAWSPPAPVDLLMPDIWLPLVDDGRINEVRAMQAKVGARAIYFWGQEMEIARHARAAGRVFDDAGIAATIADFGLPLIGPAYPGYAAKLAAAAAHWMGPRWLPEVHAAV